MSAGLSVCGLLSDGWLWTAGALVELMLGVAAWAFILPRLKRWAARRKKGTLDTFRPRTKQEQAEAVETVTSAMSKPDYWRTRPGRVSPLDDFRIAGEPDTREKDAPKWLFWVTTYEWYSGDLPYFSAALGLIRSEETLPIGSKRDPRRGDAPPTGAVAPKRTRPEERRA
jgi:hypothetical protein